MPLDTALTVFVSTFRICLATTFALFAAAVFATTLVTGFFTSGAFAATFFSGAFAAGFCTSGVLAATFDAGFSTFEALASGFLICTALRVLAGEALATDFAGVTFFVAFIAFTTAVFAFAAFTDFTALVFAFTALATCLACTSFTTFS